VLSHALLDSELEQFQLHLADSENQRLLRYLSLLERWNRTINLTALQDGPLVRRLIVEPLWVLEQLAANEPAGQYLDIGSGNGSPAIPWYVHGDFGALDLVEARSRRAAFLRRTASQLGLGGVTIHRGRLEEIGSQLGAPNWITLQGVRLTTALLEEIRSLGGENTILVWFTGQTTALIRPNRILRIPFSDRVALVFEL
jgi:16S rRNA (guanine(527)-N(7))-methyltransferase RsmG